MAPVALYRTHQWSRADDHYEYHQRLDWSVSGWIYHCNSRRDRWMGGHYNFLQTCHQNGCKFTISGQYSFAWGTGLIPVKIIWALTWENVRADMCAQHRPKSPCASAQSDQRLCCPLEETLHSLLSKMFLENILIRLRPDNILIKLRECVGLSDSSLSAHVQKYVF